MLYLESALYINIQDFLWCNVTGVSFKRFFKNYNTLPSFWKHLFQDWFSMRYVPSTKIWLGAEDRGLVFNSAIGKWTMCKSVLDVYEWMKIRGVFTIEEIKVTWEFWSPREQDYILSVFPNKERTMITQYMRDFDQDIKSDPTFGLLLSAPTTKQISQFLIAKTYEDPVRVWNKWNKDLVDVNIEEIWSILCVRSKLLFPAKLKVFYIQFLHRAYLLNKTLAKFMDIGENCSFCDQVPEMYAHLFWDCDVSKGVWEKVIEFCNEYVCIRGDIMCKETCLLSDFRSSLLILLTTKTKHYLWVCRAQGTLPYYKQLFSLIKRMREYSFKRYKYSNNLEGYNNQWEALTFDPIFDDYCN